MDAAELIDKMAETIYDRGWHQGGYVGLDGSVCLIGAVRAQYGNRAVKEVVFTALAEQLAEYPTNGNPVVYYNDHIAKSVEDVYLLLKQTKERLLQ